MADRGTNTRELARGDRGANTGAADEDSALCIAALDRLADFPSLVGIVHANLVVVRAEVDDFVSGQHFKYRFAQMDSAMVKRYGDLHVLTPSSNPARATSWHLLSDSTIPAESCLGLLTPAGRVTPAGRGSQRDDNPEARSLTNPRLDGD